jgi:septum formation protein
MMTLPPQLILGSTSPRRVELLRAMCDEFAVIPSHAEEVHDSTLGAAELCRLNARRKAGEVALHQREGTVIGADTLVTLPPHVFGKPRDLDEARSMLRELSGRTHLVVTGVCLIDCRTGAQEVFSDESDVTFKPLEESIINEYLRHVPVLDKAGAYGIQERGELLVERIAGSFNNVMGLPTEKLAPLLRARGYSVRSR